MVLDQTANESLGLRWDGEETLQYLLEQTGRRANLLALTCSGMLRGLGPEERVLTRERLEQVLRTDEDVRDQSKRWRGENALHRAVVRQALLLGRPTREEVREALRARGVTVSAQAFDEAMDHRELSYVLVPDAEGRLSCPVPLMLHNIHTERGLENGLAEDVEELRQAAQR